MNIDSLKDNLKPWIQVDTWHTGHPCDDERFHKALEKSFDEFGASISYDDFKNAIELAVEKYGINLDEDYQEMKIEEYASKAEIIGSYLLDTTKI